MQENPLLNLDGLIQYEGIRPEHIAPAIRQLIREARDVLSRITAPEVPADFDQVSEPLTTATLRLSRAWGAASHLMSVNDSEALRAAFNEMLPEVTSFWVELSQNEKLFEKYKAMRSRPDFGTWPEARHRIVDLEIRDFRLSGAELPEEKRLEVKKLSERLSALSQKFSENLLDATNAWELVLPDASRLSGIPKDTLSLYEQSAKASGKEGYRITLQFPSYIPLLQYADDRALREQAYRAFTTRASDLGPAKLDNTPVIRETLVLRKKLASLLGFRNYAEYSLATKMADSPEEVVRFLRDLNRKSRPYALRDIEELRKFAKEELGLGELMPWDISYASEKLREARYAFSDEEVKHYFTQDAVFQGLFRLVEKLYGIRIREDHASVWDPDVRFFRIETPEGKLIAQFYFDLYARPSKRGGAWMDGDRTRRLYAGKLDTPVSYQVCNFTKPAPGRPATMTHDEVQTLFHEFGHGLHHLLSEVDEAEVSGISGVEWDAVEMPSQFMENFCWNWQVVESISRHDVTGEPLPRSLFDKMVAAKNFESGMAMVRQLEFALFDMLLHMDFGPESGSVLGLLGKVREEVSVIPVIPENRFPMSFSHIFAGGYAAGYYSYKWAEVLSADAFSLFEEHGVVSPEIGGKWLREVLSRGGSRPAMQSFVAFRGRRPTVDALLRYSGMEPTAK
ncbi:MAG: M3 family metallopeptidase [Sutterellaceae bacterium]|nr:M3 family metallopeptidase [Sutterellaceae bacterium]MDD7441513.1 M3 family metallopeptidase [Sutterellaceae bacterium]MDY2867349.1 M3 family metallopeptidase [Mesosutterella sp.]